MFKAHNFLHLYFVSYLSASLSEVNRLYKFAFIILLGVYTACFKKLYIDLTCRTMECQSRIHYLANPVRQDT